jgi:hypothetical protein
MKKFFLLLITAVSFSALFAQENLNVANQGVNWNKYDFVPGMEIIFEDTLEGEQNGEFPSKWDLVGGNVENANLNGENVLMFIDMGAFLNKMGIVPLMKKPADDYLPEEFTIEFDAYFEQNLPSGNLYRVYLYDAKNQKNKIDSKI